MTTNTYKVSFVNNEIFSLKLAEGSYNLIGDMYYYKNKGFLVYAIIKAKDETEARNKAINLIEFIRGETAS
jgi:hypothetical protein